MTPRALPQLIWQTRSVRQVKHQQIHLKSMAAALTRRRRLRLWSRAESGTKCQPHRFMRIVFFRVTWAHIPGRLRLGPRLLPTDCRTLIIWFGGPEVSGDGSSSRGVVICLSASDWQLANGNWELATGNWQLRTGLWHFGDLDLGIWRD